MLFFFVLFCLAIELKKIFNDIDKATFSDHTSNVFENITPKLDTVAMAIKKLYEDDVKKARLDTVPLQELVAGLEDMDVSILQDIVIRKMNGRAIVNNMPNTLVWNVEERTLTRPSDIEDSVTDYRM